MFKVSWRQFGGGGDTGCAQHATGQFWLKRAQPGFSSFSAKAPLLDVAQNVSGSKEKDEPSPPPQEGPRYGPSPCPHQALRPAPPGGGSAERRAVRGRRVKTKKFLLAPHTFRRNDTASCHLGYTPYRARKLLIEVGSIGAGVICCGLARHAHCEVGLVVEWPEQLRLGVQ